MGSSNITVDTHSLLWYVDKGQNRKLSRLALQAIVKAEQSGMIYVPAIAFMETLFLIEKGRFSLGTTAPDQQARDFLSMIERSGIYQIVPIDASLLRVAIRLKGLNIHDRLIVATAILTGTVLVTKDKAIAARVANVAW